MRAQPPERPVLLACDEVRQGAFARWGIYAPLRRPPQRACKCAWQAALLLPRCRQCRRRRRRLWRAPLPLTVDLRIWQNHRTAGDPLVRSNTDGSPTLQGVHLMPMRAWQAGAGLRRLPHDAIQLPLLACRPREANSAAQWAGRTHAAGAENAAAASCMLWPTAHRCASSARPLAIGATACMQARLTWAFRHIDPKAHQLRVLGALPGREQTVAAVRHAGIQGPQLAPCLALLAGGQRDVEAIGAEEHAAVGCIPHHRQRRAAHLQVGGIMR